MFRLRAILSTILFLTPLFTGYAGETIIPDARLRVTVRQKEEGKLNKGIHLLDLSCSNGHCSLTSTSLNQCSKSPGGGKQSFAVLVERSSTQEGTLKVANVGNTLITEERGADVGGTYVTTLRFGYEKPAPGGIASRVLSFSGGFVKNSIVADRVLTVEFIPLVGWYHELTLDCPVRLPGVDK